MAGRYAQTTEVSSDRSEAEIKRTLLRYGATRYVSAWSPDQASIAFEIGNRRVRFTLPMPNPRDPEFTRTSQGRPRVQTAARQAYEQAIRQRWRALLLVIKAQLEAIEAGILTADDAWLAFTLLPSGQTVGERLKPDIETVYSGGRMPPLLPAHTDH